jgi:hypothetical protein
LIRRQTCSIGLRCELYRGRYLKTRPIRSHSQLLNELARIGVHITAG